MSIEFTRINNDVNGNPRYVCHFLNLISENYEMSIQLKYEFAIKKAKQLGGKKYNTKSYGGGIVFQSYNIQDLENSIIELRSQK